MFYSNCIIYAWKKYRKEGGYIAFRHSRFGSIIPHVIWVKSLGDATVSHFVPADPKRKKIPPLLFKGYVKTNDKE
jgi:hypothetical protein